MLAGGALRQAECPAARRRCAIRRPAGRPPAASPRPLPAQPAAIAARLPLEQPDGSGPPVGGDSPASVRQTGHCCGEGYRQRRAASWGNARASGAPQRCCRVGCAASGAILSVRTVQRGTRGRSLGRRQAPKDHPGPLPRSGLPTSGVSQPIGDFRCTRPPGNAPRRARWVQTAAPCPSQASSALRNPTVRSQASCAAPAS
jgi:hypothetical protein